MTKVHVDNLISWHVVGYSKLATNRFVAKLCTKLIGIKGKLVNEQKILEKIVS